MGARLRQGVLVAAELEPVVAGLRTTLGLAEPFRDPGVAAFGLHNAVCALGDTFLEVVSPTVPDTAAGRHLQRLGGDGGYMLIFQVDDLVAARERAATAGVRTVWQIDLPDMAATHLHPADLGGTLVSLDRPLPAGAWRWGGPQWTGRVGGGAPDPCWAPSSPYPIPIRWHAGGRRSSACPSGAARSSSTADRCASSRAGKGWSSSSCSHPGSATGRRRSAACGSAPAERHRVTSGATSPAR